MSISSILVQLSWGIQPWVPCLTHLASCYTTVNACSSPEHLEKNGIHEKEKCEMRLILWMVVLCCDHLFYILACFALYVLDFCWEKKIMEKHEYSVWPELFLGITVEQETNSRIKASLTWKRILFIFIYLFIYLPVV